MRKLRGNCGKKHLFSRKYGSFLKVFPQKNVFPELIFTFWENILLGNCLLGNNTSGKVSLWETVLLGNWPSGKLPTGKQAFWETVLLGNFLLGKILWETVFWELTSGKLPNTHVFLFFQSIVNYSPELVVLDRENVRQHATESNRSCHKGNFSFKSSIHY